jgi:PAS domain S-box-containing protein
MVQFAQSRSRLPFETAIRNPAAPLESIVRTEEMYKRPSRAPDYEKENLALTALVGALADSPNTILQTLADKVLDVLRCDSAGVSLLTKDEQRFYWAAIAGEWRPHAGGGTPRNFGPSGDVLDRNIPMLFTRWERRYPYLGAMLPVAEEGLLVPFYVNGRAAGTIWAIAHNIRRKFDAEDLRILQSIGRFASEAYKSADSLGNIKLGIAAREKAEGNLRDLADTLEEQVLARAEKLHFSEGRWRSIFDNSAVGLCVVTLDGRFEMANSAFQRMIGFTEKELSEKTYLDLCDPEFRAFNAILVAELLGGKRKGFSIEKQCRRKDGRLIWVRLNISVLSGIDGNPRNLLSIIEDIAEHKATEESLQPTVIGAQVLAAGRGGTADLEKMGMNRPQLSRAPLQRATVTAGVKCVCIENGMESRSEASEIYRVDPPAQVIRSFTTSNARIDLLRFAKQDSEELEFLTPYHLVVLLSDGLSKGCEWSDGRETRRLPYLAPNTVMFSPAGSYLRIRTTIPQNYRQMLMLAIQPTLMKWRDDLEINLAVSQFRQQIVLKDAQACQTLVAIQQELEAPGINGAFYIDVQLFLLLTRLIRRASNLAETSESIWAKGGLPNWRLKRAIELLEGKSGKIPKLAEVARLIGLSKSSFCRCFKHSTGLSPHRYILEKQVNHAKEMMNDQRLNLTEIAFDCGFSSSSQFSIVFKRIAGMSPRDFRRAL